jgi:hypothetical protein
LSHGASALTAPDKANQYPHESEEYRASYDGQVNEYAHRIHHEERAAFGVKAIEAADGRGQSQQVLFRHLQDMFVGIVLRFPGQVD